MSTVRRLRPTSFSFRNLDGPKLVPPDHCTQSLTLIYVEVVDVFGSEAALLDTVGAEYISIQSAPDQGWTEALTARPLSLHPACNIARSALFPDSDP